MSHPDGGPEEKASLVQGSGRSSFSSIFIWQIPCYYRGPGYTWAASFVSPAPSLWHAVGIVSCVTGIQLPVRLGKHLGMEWKSPGTDALWALVEEKLCCKASCSFRESGGGGSHVLFSFCTCQCSSKQRTSLFYLDLCLLLFLTLTKKYELSSWLLEHLADTKVLGQTK